MALRSERHSARMSKNYKGGLDQSAGERFCRLIFATIRKSVRLKGLMQELSPLQSYCSTISATPRLARVLAILICSCAETATCRPYLRASDQNADSSFEIIDPDFL